MKAADEGEEGRPTHPSTMAGRDLCGGSPGAAQVSVLVCLGALFLTPWLRAGSQLPGGGERGGDHSQVWPHPSGMLGCHWGHSPLSRCQGRHKPPVCAAPPKPAKIPKIRGWGRWKTMAASSPLPEAFVAALAVHGAKHHSRLALHRTMGLVPPQPGCHRARPRVTVPTVPGEAGKGAAISSADRFGQ